MRLRTNEPNTISALFYDGGEAVVDPGTVTIGITGYLAVPVVAPGSATTGSGAGSRSLAVTPTVLDDWTVTWTGAAGRKLVGPVAVVGGRYFELAELRAQPNLNDTSRFSPAKLVNARDAVEDLIESWCGVSFVPRHKQVVYSGQLNHLNVQRTRKLVRTTVNGVDMIAPPTFLRGELNWAFANPLPYPSYLGPYNPLTGGPDKVVIDLEVGWDAPPQDLKDAALDLARYTLLNRENRIPDRATTMTTEHGTFNLTYAGPDRPTDLPMVNTVLNRYRRRTLVFA